MDRKRHRCSSEPKRNSGIMNIVFSRAIGPQAGEAREISSLAMHIIVRFPPVRHSVQEPAAA
jgi:hypothetical protein